MIKFENISKKFDKKQVLTDVSFQIEEDEIVGLYGDSGCGKSTVAKIACGLVVPDGGQVYADGIALYDKKFKYDRRTGLNIQMVYQQPFSALDPSQKILRGFEELIRYHRFAKDKKDVSALIDKTCALVELDKSILNHLPHQISGGEAQRIAIAKALLFKPKLIIMDEATSMLDATTQANVLAMLKRELAKFDGSMLLISHDDELVNFYCSKIYDMQDGKVKLRECSDKQETDKDKNNV